MAAPLLRRFLSSILDGIICSMLSIVLFYPLSNMMYLLGDYSWIPSYIFIGIYFVVFETKLSRFQTVGRRILGIELRSIESEKISIPRSIGRYAIFIIPFANGQISNLIANTIGFTNSKLGGVVYLTFVGILFTGLTAFMWFRKDKRGIHDVIFGTMLVKRNSEIDNPNKIFVLPSMVGSIVMFGILVWIFGGLLPSISNNDSFKELNDVATRIRAKSPVEITNIQYVSFKKLNDNQEKITLYATVSVPSTYNDKATREQLEKTIFDIMKSENRNDLVKNMKITSVVKEFYGLYPVTKKYTNVQDIVTSP